MAASSARFTAAAGQVPCMIDSLVLEPQPARRVTVVAAPAAPVQGAPCAAHHSTGAVWLRPPRELPAATLAIVCVPRQPSVS